MKRQERTTSKQRRRPKSKRHKISARTTKTYRPPRTSEEFFALPKKFQDQWNRVVQVPSEMRAQGLSLPQATRPLGVSPKTVIRLAGSAFTKRRGRYQVKPTDRLLRVLV